MLVGNTLAPFASPRPLGSPPCRSIFRPSASAQVRSITDGSTPVSKSTYSGLPLTVSLRPITESEKSNGIVSDSRDVATDETVAPSKASPQTTTDPKRISLPCQRIVLCFDVLFFLLAPE